MPGQQRGTDWLAKYGAQVDCEKKVVKFFVSRRTVIRNFEDEIILRGESVRTRKFSYFVGLILFNCTFFFIIFFIRKKF